MRSTLMQVWAQDQMEKKGIEAESQTNTKRHTKKLRWQTTFGEISLLEQTYTKKGKLVRPSSRSAKVVCRSYSIALQRALTAFGADESFAKAIEKVKEHYGIDIPASSCRNVIQKHASNIKKHKREI